MYFRKFAFYSIACKSRIMTTLTEKAYEALRQDIVRGTLKPGQQLRMAELSAQYQMGFSPLREALSRLQAEGLTVLAPLRGFTVATLSISEMWDTINLRILIECEALRLSMQKGGDDWEAGIVSTLHALMRQYERNSGSENLAVWELESRHHAFHMQLVSACGSPRMLKLIEQLYVDTERYRIPILLQSTPHRGRNIQEEHTAIADAVLACQSESAIQKLVEHYRLTALAIEKWTQANINSMLTNAAQPTGAARKIKSVA
jgi:GntR family transcriptional regulator, carbon starvation induced regulator